VSVTGWVGLGLEEGIEVPERTFHISVGFHLFETHLQEDFDELLSGLHQ
jgi:hypothetical protein